MASNILNLIGRQEAIAVLRSKQPPDGSWLMENTHPGAVPFVLEMGDGRFSRWNTLRALRVLRWSGLFCDPQSVESVVRIRRKSSPAPLLPA